MRILKVFSGGALKGRQTNAIVGFVFLMGVAAKLNGRLRSVITIIINKDTCEEYYNP